LPDLPRDPSPDATLALLRDPYRAIPRRAAELGAEIYRTRLMGRRAYCLTGRDAAALFYDPAKFTRQGAVPRPVGGVIFGPRGVIQDTDGAEHLHRKRAMMDLAARDAPDDLARRLRAALDARPTGGDADAGIDLFVLMREAILVAVCGWAGVPLAAEEVPGRAETMTRMFTEAGSLGPVGRWRGMRARRKAQAWIGGLIGDVRAGRGDLPGAAPLARVAGWTHADGRLLDREVAAADLLSIMRPTVANAVWIVHLAQAIHRHPDWAARLADPDDRTAFVREVRRCAPFFPILSATVGDGVVWEGALLETGARAVLSIWGTNHDPAVWDNPDRFEPGRHLGSEPGPFDMIPQGGGDYLSTHRCAGEWITIRQMEAAADWLTQAVAYEVATPEVEPDMSSLPALPPGGFRLRGLRAA
jgi:fatty-acid peroxygenase